MPLLHFAQWNTLQPTPIRTMSFLNRDWPQDCGNEDAGTRTLQPDIDQRF
jgi:hypothetical protein